MRFDFLITFPKARKSFIGTTLKFHLNETRISSRGNSPITTILGLQADVYKQKESGAIPNSFLKTDNILPFQFFIPLHKLSSHRPLPPDGPCGSSLSQWPQLPECPQSLHRKRYTLHPNAEHLPQKHRPPSAYH